MPDDLDARSDAEYFRDRAAELEAQRDALLAACRAALTEWGGWGRVLCTPDEKRVVDQIAAAVTFATAGDRGPHRCICATLPHRHDCPAGGAP